MLPLAHARPLGWTPSVGKNDDQITPYTPNRGSYSFSNSGQISSPSSTDMTSYDDPGPDFIARPRNAFIVFRCEYSKNHRRQGRRIRMPPGTSTGPTLSERAGVAWKQMSREEKEPYIIRAEEERVEHARKHPEYRFRPLRRLRTDGRRYHFRQSTSNLLPESTHDGRQAAGLPDSVSSGLVDPLSLILGRSCPDLQLLEDQMSILKWKSPLSRNIPRGNTSCGKPTVEIPTTFPLNGEALSQSPEADLKEPSETYFGTHVDETPSLPATFPIPTLPFDLNCPEPILYEYPEPIFQHDCQPVFQIDAIPPKVVLPPTADWGTLQSPGWSDGIGNWAWTFPSPYQNLSSCSMDMLQGVLTTTGGVDGCPQA